MHNELIKELETAVLMLSRITVSGDAVDFMAAAKAKVRAVAAELKKEEKSDG